MSRIVDDAGRVTAEAGHALIEVQVMSGAIAKIVQRLIDDCAGTDFEDLEAIKACLMRLDANIDPLVEIVVAEK